MRVGMHSGPVTAGVLRGDRARFQLFGDTVNTGTCLVLDVSKAAFNILPIARSPFCTASRMETSGRKGMVHLSEQTANELIKHGKKDWIMARDDVVVAKGKGKLVTFWFKDAASRSNSLSASSSTGKSVDAAASDTDETSKPESTIAAVDKKPAAILKKTEPRIAFDEKVDRIVEWNSKMLLQLLEPIVTRRKALGRNGASTKKDAKGLTAIAQQMGSAAMVIDEVVEIIDMPPFVRLEAIDNVVLDDEVVAQVHSYVKKIANMYNDNPCKWLVTTSREEEFLPCLHSKLTYLRIVCVLGPRRSSQL
jgi:Adenylate and Guanylate cyclase catalytic domain